MSDPATIAADVSRPARPATRVLYFAVVRRGDSWCVYGTYEQEEHAREFAIGEMRAPFGYEAADYRVLSAELPVPPAPEPKP